MNNYGDKIISVFGFKFKIKNLLLTLIIACAVAIALVLVDMYITKISWYGVIIGTAFLVAIMFSTQLFEFRGLQNDFAFDLILWIFPLSIICARAYYVICSPEEFSNFGEMIAVWNGGIAIYGGIIGGLIGLIICCLIKKKNIISTMDVAAPCLIIAQAIGRWGNFINQELYGWEIKNKAFQWFTKEADQTNAKVQLYIGYSKDAIKATGGTKRLAISTNTFSELLKSFMQLYDNTTNRNVLIRRIGIALCGLEDKNYEQLNLFIDHKRVEKEQKIEKAINEIKLKNGKNAILRGMNLEAGATARIRNTLIGGHNG